MQLTKHKVRIEEMKRLSKVMTNKRQWKKFLDYSQEWIYYLSADLVVDEDISLCLFSEYSQSKIEAKGFRMVNN